jgi:hypothetical protein
MMSSLRLLRPTAAALVFAGGLTLATGAEAQKKPGGTTCTMPPADARFLPVTQLNDGYGAGFGNAALLAPARYAVGGEERHLLVAAVGSNASTRQMHFFLLDPETGQPVTASPVIKQIPLAVDGTAAGSSRGSIGEVNGDGIPDVLIGDSGPSSAALFVSMVTAEGTIDWAPIALPRGAGTTADRALSHFGWAVALGDVDGDGRDEMAVTKFPTSSGKTTQPGEVFVYRYVASTGTVALVDRIAQGQVTPSLANADSFGSSVAIGDVAGGSGGDLIVGAHGRAVNGVTGAGAVLVFEGSGTAFVRAARVLTSTPLVKGSGVGYRVAAGDVTGDGRADVVATTNWDTNTHGLVFAGPVASGQAGILRFEPQPGYATGWATNAPVVGDVTGDGRADIVVGAPNAGNSGGCNSPGMVYLFAGVGVETGQPTTAWTRHVLPPPVVTGDYTAFGWTTALAGGYPFLGVHQRAGEQVFVYRVTP